MARTVGILSHRTDKIKCYDRLSPGIGAGRLCSSLKGTGRRVDDDETALDIPGDYGPSSYEGALPDVDFVQDDYVTADSDVCGDALSRPHLHRGTRTPGHRGSCRA